MEEVHRGSLQEVQANKQRGNRPRGRKLPWLFVVSQRRSDHRPRHVNRRAWNDKSPFRSAKAGRMVMERSEEQDEGYIPSIPYEDLTRR
jgi:hypothetical protein